MERTALYRTIWRWHFYAGLFVIPLINVLALSGSVYLFKPQIDRWEERAFRNLPTASAVSPEAQVRAALATVPGAGLASYTLPERPGDAAMVHLTLPDRKGMRDAFVSPQGEVLGVLDPESRIIAVVRRIHGQLLLGPRGSWIVELAASWAIVMVLTGLFLWWPDRRGLAGVLWPRLTRGARVLLRDLHAVTGFWVAGLTLVLLVTGLPWADAWGSSFKAVRENMGWINSTAQDWTLGGKPAGTAAGGEHAGHDHEAMMQQPVPPAVPDMLSQIVAEARRERLAFPVIVTPPPGAPQRFGARPDESWTVRSDAQNRPLRVTISYDPQTGRETSRETFADKHPLDRAIGYGIAWHEGQLFGWVNQLIGVLTAVMLVTLATTGFLMWRRRKPDGLLGAPPLPAERKLAWLVPAILVLAALLPLLAASLIAMLLFDRLLLPHLPRLSCWLGVPARDSREMIAAGV